MDSTHLPLQVPPAGWPVANIAERDSAAARQYMPILYVVADATADSRIATGGATYLYFNGTHHLAGIHEVPPGVGGGGPDLAWQTQTATTATTPIDLTYPNHHITVNAPTLLSLQNLGNNLGRSGTLVLAQGATGGTVDLPLEAVTAQGLRFVASAGEGVTDLLDFRVLSATAVFFHWYPQIGQQV